jgi:hypothetical protein
MGIECILKAMKLTVLAAQLDLHNQHISTLRWWQVYERYKTNKEIKEVEKEINKLGR